MKERKAAFAFISFLLASSLCYSAQNFNMIWSSGETPPPTYLSSNLDAAPVISAPSLVCTGTPTQITFSSTPVWNVGYLDGGTANGANQDSENQLLGAPGASSSYSVAWITQGQINSLHDYANPNVGNTARYWRWTTVSGVNDWNPFLSSIGVGGYPEYSAGIKYKNYGSPNYFPNPHLAYVALFCNGYANMQVSGPTTLSFSDAFTGSQITKSQTLPAGSYTVSGNLAVQRCLASIRNDGTYNTRSVYAVIGDSFQPTFTATTATITVEPKFTCNVATQNPSFSPNPVPSGQTVSFSFTIKNNDVRDIIVTSLALEAGSQFSSLAITSHTFPFTVSKGGSATVSGTAKAPTVSSQTVVPLRILMNGNSATADCEDLIKPCTDKLVLDVPVTVTPGTKPNYVPILPSVPSQRVGVPFSVTIITRNIGSAAGGAASKTQINFTDAVPVSREVDVPALAVGAESPSPQSFTCTSPGQKQLNVSVDSQSQIVESNEGDNFASIFITCEAALLPDYLVEVPAAISAVAGKPFSLAIVTRNRGEAAANAPNPSTTTATFNGITQSHPVANLGIQAADTWYPVTFTCPAAGGTFQLVARADANFNVISESNENNNVNTTQVTCVRQPASCTLSGSTSFIHGGSGQFSATCFDSAASPLPCPDLTWTTTVTDSNMAPPFTASPAYSSTLNVGANAAYGSGYIVKANSSAFDCTRQVTVSPVDNPATSCTLSGQPAFRRGESGLIAATCSNATGSQVNCPNMSWSTNLADSFMSPDFTTPATMPRSTLNVGTTTPLGPGRVRANSSAFECFHAVQVQQNLPVRCTLSGASEFAPGGSGQFSASCFDAANSRVDCTALSWKTNVTGSMTPPSTPASFAPSSYLYVSTSATAGGYAVNATSSSFNCTAPFRVAPPAGFSLACSLVSHSEVFYPNENAQVRADCSSGASPTPCPALSWSTDISGAYLSPDSTTARPTPAFSTFYSPVTPPSSITSGTITVACANPSDCSATCSVSIDFSSVPDTMECSLSVPRPGPPYQFLPTDRSDVSASCSNGTRVAACPALHWTTDVSGGRIDPDRTNRTESPSTTFRTTGAPAQSGRTIDAASTEADIDLSCSAPIFIDVVVAIGPDYIVSRMKVPTEPIPVNQKFPVDVDVTNIGNRGATDSSKTHIDSGCTPADLDDDPLGVGEVHTHLYTCACTVSGVMSITATADAYNNVVDEISETNNARTAPVQCGMPFLPACFDYV